MAAGITIALGGLVWKGPLLSGAFFLSLGSGTFPVAHDLSRAYRPRHKGGVDVSTGLYVREDEDLILRRTPPFKLTRTYLAGDRVSRQFGIGATNNGEWYLIGDPNQFQWAELILASGSRIHFDRTSRGTSYANAMFLHLTTPTEFFGARLGWTGRRWALRFADGSLATFQACDPGRKNLCSLIEQRDADGHHVRFRRDPAGRLTAIETLSERMTFLYDHQNRVSAAQIDGGPRMQYTYDDDGRLVGVHGPNGVAREYTYGPHDEMLTIREPGWFIENMYDGNIRVVRQVTHFDPTPDDPQPG